MNPQTALTHFLSNALSKRKERLIGFASKTKTQDKFLAMIDHDLESCWDERRIVETLPDDVLDAKGFLFSSEDGFGVEVGTFGDYVDSTEDSFLVISKDGHYGIYSPENWIDDRVYLKA